MPIRREEKRRRVHEALLNMLYPPPPSPPQVHEEQLLDASPNLGFNYDSFSVDQEESGSSSSSDAELENDPQKLTRAQRKKLRKKKLKENAMQRRKLIGPLLPSTSSEASSSFLVEDGLPSVRHKSSEGLNAANEDPCCSNLKLNHRRKAKRKGKGEGNSSNVVKIN